jgi:hypothetical protein
VSYGEIDSACYSVDVETVRGMANGVPFHSLAGDIVSTVRTGTNYVIYN